MKLAEEIDQFDKIEGVLSPKHLETLREEVKQYIGKKCTFQALWIIETGQYTGQRAFRMLKCYDGTEPLPLWSPFEDIIQC